TQRGVNYDAFQLVERDLNARLAREKKLTGKHLRVRFFFVSVTREELFPALVAGKGDIAAANRTITPQRRAIVDFATPHTSDVRQLVVTGPAGPAMSTLDDLAGQEVFVRTSSAYYESLIDLNNRFAAENKPAIRIKEAPEELEDEDMVEMLNAGLVHILVLDK